MNNNRDAVVAAVDEVFPKSDLATIMGLLDLYGTESHERERERVQLAIVALSNGDENALLNLIEAAKRDYRDVLFWQERGPLSEVEGQKLQRAARDLLEKWADGA